MTSYHAFIYPIGKKSYYYNTGGTSHVKVYRDVPLKWVSFSPKIHRQASNFSQENHQKRVLFHLNYEKNVKSALCKAKKLQKCVPIYDNFNQKKKNIKSAIFLGRKILRNGQWLQILGRTTHQKIIQVLPPPQYPSMTKGLN